MSETVIIFIITSLLGILIAVIGFFQGRHYIALDRLFKRMDKKYDKEDADKMVDAKINTHRLSPDHKRASA